MDLRSPDYIFNVGAWRHDEIYCHVGRQWNEQLTDCVYFIRQRLCHNRSHSLNVVNISLAVAYTRPNSFQILSCFLEHSLSVLTAERDFCVFCDNCKKLSSISLWSSLTTRLLDYILVSSWITTDTLLIVFISLPRDLSPLFTVSNCISVPLCIL